MKDKKYKIIQYHLDNNLKKVSGNFSNELSRSEKEEINSILKLSEDLKSIRVSDSFGKQSLRSTLLELEAPVEANKKFTFSIFKYATLTMSALAIAVVFGAFGLNGFRLKQSSPQASQISSISTNGTVESVDKVNLADIEIEQAELSKDSSLATSVKTELSSGNNIAEAINKAFRHKYVASFLLLLALSLAYSPQAFAKKEQLGFCGNLGNISSQMISNMQSKKHTRISARKIDNDKLATIRAQSDSKRDEAFNKLYANYNSEAQKTAIDQYKQTLQQAIDLRRQRTDLARQNFISEVNSIIASREESLSSSESKIITSVQAARDLANLRCLEGASPDEVKATFKQSLSTAKNDFYVDRNLLDKQKIKIDELVETRKNIIDSAINDYKTAAEKARQILKNELN